MASCHGTRIRDKRTPLVIGIVLIGRGEAETRIFSAINSRRLAEGKKRLQIIPRLPPWIFAFSFGANRDFLVFLSLSFFSPFENDEIKIIGSRAFHGMEIEMRRETEPFDIFHPRVLMALRLNVPENLRHEQLAHYFTSMWILACIEFPIRIVEGFEHVLRRNVLRRGEENASFYLLFSIDRDLSPKSNNSSKITRVELKRSIIDLP